MVESGSLFSLKPSAFVGESSSTFEFITINCLRGVSKQTDKKTHWYPIALDRRYDNPCNLFQVCIILPKISMVSRPEGQPVLVCSIILPCTRTGILNKTFQFRYMASIMWSYLFHPNLKLFNIHCKYLAWRLKYRRDLKIGFLKALLTW